MCGENEEDDSNMENMRQWHGMKMADANNQ